MPESSSIKSAFHPSPIVPHVSVSPSFSSMITGAGVTMHAQAVLNGALSPHHGLNGRTPSPPSIGNTNQAQQLPPACGARQLSKLKRFLTTLQQFGSDISPEIGDRVRSLVLALVNNHLSIEEFHSKLQEATNFPLRPFVIPFLKANLPLLQRELLHCARLAKQSPQQYLAHNEHVLFDPAHSPLEPQDLNTSDFNEIGKRRSPDRSKENGFDVDAQPPVKRINSVSPVNQSVNRVSPNTTPLVHGGPIRLEDISLSREMRERERLERERQEKERVEHPVEPRERSLSASSVKSCLQRPDSPEMLEKVEDEWKYISDMLQNITNMVENTRKAISTLQEKSVKEKEDFNSLNRRFSDGIDSDSKKRPLEVPDNVAEVKRRAEEAVNEVKRQAVAELQKAVSAAEKNATEMIAAERLKMEQSVVDVRRKTADEVMVTLNQQDESTESCWNCGRKASETCSGCNVARYCGAFCQHKDWESHHHVCGSQEAVQEILASRCKKIPTQPSDPQTTIPNSSNIDQNSGSLTPPSAGSSIKHSSPVNSSQNSFPNSRSNSPIETAANKSPGREV